MLVLVFYKIRHLTLDILKFRQKWELLHVIILATALYVVYFKKIQMPFYET